MKKVLIFVSPKDSDLVIEKIVSGFCNHDTVIMTCENITPELVHKELEKQIKREEYALRAKNHIINNLRKLLNEK